MQTWQPGTSLETLKKRAELLQKTRAFFLSKGVLEVETPSLSRFPTLDLHLESFQTSTKFTNRTSYLITSPEYHMKRLIAAGSGSIFQICKAFRCDESGARHNPEFSILEWYRQDWDHWKLMTEIELLLERLLGTGKAEYLSYNEAFQHYLMFDPLTISKEIFLDVCRQKEVVPPADLEASDTEPDEWLNYLLGMFIEPQLGATKPLFLHDYPASQASLAKLNEGHPETALRFEVYYQGIELGNGFSELTDARLQEERFCVENKKRKQLGKEELAIDQNFLNALKHGMPECSGVAMGFDRLVMLALHKKSINEVMTFTWDHC